MEGYVKKIQSGVCSDCPHYKEVNHCSIGVQQFLFSGGKLSDVCSKNPNCEHRQLLIANKNVEAMQEKVDLYREQVTLVNSKIAKRNEMFADMQSRLKVYRARCGKCKPTLGDTRTFAEKEFSRVLKRQRALLDKMSVIQDQYERGSREYLVARTVSIIIKKSLGFYARAHLLEKKGLKSFDCDLERKEN